MGGGVCVLLDGERSRLASPGGRQGRAGGRGHRFRTFLREVLLLLHMRSYLPINLVKMIDM